MWQTKYASAVPKNLGLGLNFRPCSEDYFLLWASVVRDHKDLHPMQPSIFPYNHIVLKLNG